MDSAELKQNIRRRLFATKFKKDPASAAAASGDFLRCPDCAGTGKVCHSSFSDGVPTETLDVCERCEGEGFI